MAGKPIQSCGRPRGPGRPKLGSWRLETVLPAAVLDELKKREEKTGIYRTRLCAAILERELLGGSVRSFNRPSA